MEEINLQDLFKYFLNKILIIILITVFFGLMGSLYCLLLQKPMYKSSTTLLLANISEIDSNNSNSITTSDITLNQKLISTYREIMKSRRILKQVITNLSLEYDVDTLGTMITVDSINDTEIISITVKNSDPILAMRIANEVANTFCNEIVNIYQIKNINIIDKAELNDVPYNINLVKQIVIYLLIGFVLSCAVVFVIYYFDTTVKTKEEVEEKIGLPVLGIIPLKKEARK